MGNKARRYQPRLFLRFLHVTRFPHSLLAFRLEDGSGCDIVAVLRKKSIRT